MFATNNIFRRGEMFWADLGEIQGSEQSGTRPVIIIQNDVGNRYSPTVIVVICSTRISKAKLPTHILLDKKRYIGLNDSTLVLSEQIRTLDKKRLSSYICTLDDSDLIKLDKAVNISLQLNRINSIILEDIEKIKKNINEIDIFIKGWVKKGLPIYDLKNEFILRNRLINELKAICRKNDLRFYEFYDEFEINKVLAIEENQDCYTKPVLV